MTDTFTAARTWLHKQEPAVSGQSGHNQTFHVACVLVHGFSLSDSDAWHLLNEYNAGCRPPWSERELRHKLDDASRTTPDKPRGFMLRKSHHNGAATRTATITKPSTVTNKPVPPSSIPAPIPDGARLLIKSLFKEGEGIRLCHARLNDEEREVPDGEGPCHSREFWLNKLDGVGGDPNGFFQSTKRTGIYISLNPMKIGGSRDSDVTAFRHCLVEFDDIPKEEQWRLYTESGLPCAAIISSGGKSLHAWVKVDAKDRQEYDERVRTIYDHFTKAGYRPDVKNKNPSRYSRLPNCVRFHSRQELLALNVGAESFSDWRTKVEADGIGETVTVDQLMEFVPSDDTNTILGARWLCRGGSCLIVGPSGIGKSTLTTQMAATWATGRAAFGIAPVRPLKSLIIQAENDMGDLAEMLQGVLGGLGVDGFGQEQEFELVRNNLVFVRDTSHTGYEFCEAVRRLIDRHKPDLVWFDPLLSFIGADISKQEVCSQFLRNWLNPISGATGVVWMCVHHTGKPPNDKKARDGWTSNDYAYSGIGSSELVNWARAVCVLRAVTDGTVELKLAKRGSRAKATHPSGEPTTSLWLQQSHTSLRWEQIEPPEEPAQQVQAAKTKKEKLPLGKRIAVMNLASFLAGCTAEGESGNKIAERLKPWLLENHGLTIGRSTICKDVLPELIGPECRKLELKFDRYFRGPNA